MKARLTILTHKRPGILELCLLKLGRPEGIDIIVYDTDPGLSAVALARAAGATYRSAVFPVDKKKQPAPASGDKAITRAAQMSCGAGRAKIVADFLAEVDAGDYLVMLDDDIYVGERTIIEALQDFEALRKTVSVACLALHPFKKRVFKGAKMTHETMEFRTFDFTGECAMLWPRDVLEKVGNHFGPAPGGHGDTQYAAAKEAGCFVTRYDPPYTMQHVGTYDLGGSVIFGHLEKKPGWVREPLRDYVTARIFYEEDLALWRAKGLDALKATLKERTMGEKSIGTKLDDARDQFPKARGKVEIDKVRASDGEVVEREVIENLVVDKAKELMAHLLAGDSPDDYKVRYMVFGTNGDEPSASDLQVKAPITPVKNIDSVDYPNDSSVRFIVTLQQSEANGFPLAEAGLQANNGLVARVSYGPLTKDSDFIFIYRWTIYW